MGWFLFWMILVAVAIVAEFIALYTDNMPLTQAYLRLACSTLLRTVLFAFFFWMLWHWMIQPWFFVDTNGWLPIDLAFVALGGFVGWKIGPPKWGIDCGEEDDEVQAV